jgi:hypothetical protein
MKGDFCAEILREPLTQWMSTILIPVQPAEGV